jgi:hypothetical protein
MSFSYWLIHWRSEPFVWKVLIRIQVEPDLWKIFGGVLNSHSKGTSTTQEGIGYYA